MRSVTPTPAIYLKCAEIEIREREKKRKRRNEDGQRREGEVR
jgi:hypothetical protein